MRQIREIMKKTHKNTNVKELMASYVVNRDLNP